MVLEKSALFIATIILSVGRDPILSSGNDCRVGNISVKITSDKDPIFN